MIEWIISCLCRDILPFYAKFLIDERPHVSREFAIHKDHVIDFVEFHQGVVYLHGSHWSGTAASASAL